MELLNRADELDAALVPWQSQIPAFVEGLRSAVGAEPSATLGAQGAEVLAWVIQASGELLTAWVVTPGTVVLFEMTRGGDQLTVAVPVLRLRRVAESMIEGAYKLTLEIDADRGVLTGRTLDDGSLLGSLSPTVYELVSADGEDLGSLRTFARQLRGALAAL